MTGPTYELRGKAELNGRTLPYKFERSHAGPSDQTVSIECPDESVRGWLEWKRHKTGDDWTIVPMTAAGGTLSAKLPHQPPAGKLEYRVRLSGREGTILIPSDRSVVIRFRGDVPGWILVPHIIVMFAAMLFSTRAGLEYFTKVPRLKGLTWWTIGFLFVGGIILGPLVQKYAFDAYWTGWPFGTDLTDNKTFVALLAWVMAGVALLRSRKPQAWALGAAIVLLLVYLIPHSLLGSELDYKQMERGSPGAPASSPAVLP